MKTEKTTKRQNDKTQNDKTTKRQNQIKNIEPA
jgi:hypothetical protein